MFRARSLPFALAAALGVTSHARAQSKAAPRVFTASIEYSAPSACPSAADFKAIVVGRLGFDPFAKAAPKHVLVVIAEGERALEGRLEWRDEKGWAGDQTFPSHTNDCAELVRTMGFALAVQINLLTTERAPEAVSDRSAAHGNDTTTPETKAAPASPVPERPASQPDVTAAPTAREPRRGAAWAAALGAGGSLGLGLLPKATFLGRVFGSAAWGHASLELGGELSTRAGTDRADGAGFSARAWLASAAVCGNLEPWSLCLVAKAGAVDVQGRRIDVPASPNGTAVLTGLRVGARARVGRTFFFASRVEGLFNLTRWTVTLDKFPVWTAPVFAGTLGVDVGAIFQ